MIGMLKWILSPLAPIYWSVSALRNYLFNAQIFRTQSVEIPTISVGNLSAGGTGKSPHCDALLGLLQDRRPSLLSRGYGRSSKGFFWVDEDSESSLTGDEPLMLKKRNPTVPIAVCENRVQGAVQMMADSQDIHVLVLDDAFQHLWIGRDLDIVLSRWDKPFFKDFILPIGKLREPRFGLKRAQIIVITYCPEKPSLEQIVYYRKASSKYTGAPVLFSRMVSAGIHWVSKIEKISDPKRVLLVAGIAHPNSFVQSFLEAYPGTDFQLLQFKDHHHFTEKEIQKILTLATEFDAVVTTEKDLIRLPVEQFKEAKLSLGFLKIEVEWLFNGKDEMKKQLDALFTS